ncbi:MAG: pyridoxal-5'-phosphate-dependent protein subunit beta, partial [Deltaproteobacteria bacterium]|nr:pyridoxal-5'-phosphate-dependent protein subunit beta [Deltaproteobacteria bacterium]
HRAIWPSTGNYCRGGVAISKLLQSRGVAVLPEGMSEERFEWLSKWTSDPSDVIRTYGTESNVKEIYDKCNELAEDPGNVIFNQFCEFGNHLVHVSVTGPAMAKAFEAVKASHPGLRAAAFTSATGSAGTIAAGDYLKDQYGTKIVAAEALECPTMLYNGFGEHNIQGIGDKHIPYIHNVMNTDVAVAISDQATDSLFYLFNSDAGQAHLQSRGLSESEARAMIDFGFSGICNVLSSIKTAKLLGLGKDEAIITVATDGADLYRSEEAKILAKRFGGSFGEAEAKQVFDHHMMGTDTDNILALSEMDKNRIFNLGYFTWVEQQGVTVEEFEKRRSQEFWKGLRDLVPVWDRMIGEFNRDSGVSVG